MNNVIEQERYTCAIGALQSVVAIPRAVPILHSGPGCGDMIQGFFERSTGYAGGSTSPCTNFSEKEVVFGGIDRLRDIVANTYKVLDTDLQVILTGCTAGIVGDDVDSLAEEFREKGKPVVSVEAAGFKCNNYEAHSLVVGAIIDQYVDLYADDNESRSEPNTVNLLASLPYQDPFWKGNFGEYKRLLEGLGLKVHVLFGPQSDGVKEWQKIPRSGFNILVSPWYGKPIADKLKAKYGQPYTWFPHIPIGANQTERFLRQVLDFALEQGASVDRGKAEAFIKREREAYYEEIDNLATFLLEFRYGLPSHVHILHDAGYVVGLSKFLLHEVGIVPKEQFVTDNTPEKYQAQIEAELSSTSDKRKIPITFEPDAGLAQEAIRRLSHNGRGLIIGSGWDKELAKEKNYDFLSAALPSPYRLVLSTNYAGFSGGLRVIEDIYHNVLATYR
ncbi:nitrogenase molybdenum-iron protein beta chain [Ruminiclostridium sufflavum DSM 19573]|uniref:Nitrogenase molybdenum-iron protein beta chain n=1 Tax=Ruminiclostridium sufflavum DSM 19573 TaxID=1121337 RepID=A0A318XZW6_9FIRM|nr:nitrogenase component 1 [Ruminiclostridium sufflavum]PYG88540.1 nitrogenase molybdenum-iron protein beta chain [Ruminiclostridium sufflavum DSM 19573]